MKLFRFSATTLALLIATAFAAGTALAAKPVPISAKYSGTAATKVNGDLADISATGTGTGTFGAGKLSAAGQGDSSQQPCVPFGGTGTITGTSTIVFKVVNSASGCGDEGGHVFSVKGTALVLKATGKLAKAKGSLRFTGVYDRDNGTFNVKFSGTLTK